MQKYFSCKNVHEVKLGMENLFLIFNQSHDFPLAAWQPLLSSPDVEQQNQAPEVSMLLPWCLGILHMICKLMYPCSIQMAA